MSSTHQSRLVAYEPTRESGLKRLEKFVPRAGLSYATQRNFDLGPGNHVSVSTLSAWIKHRLITEQEVLSHVLTKHPLSEALPFVQEVFWRGYFKGWLQHRPSVWFSYQDNLAHARNDLERSAVLKSTYDEAIKGRTGIECFDHWSRELRTTGYLHNHARMWFASIWIFTLRLPWELGASFFMNHLIDGDPAANTLSWRWVAGLHTKGKTYLAQPTNIAKFTNGRFNPIGQLAQKADPIVDHIEHPIVPLPRQEQMPEGDVLLLVTPQDCLPETALPRKPAGVLGLLPSAPHTRNEKVTKFEYGAVSDAVLRIGDGSGSVITAKDWSVSIIDAAERSGVSQIVTLAPALGPVAHHLETAKSELEKSGLRLYQHQRAYDLEVWPHATKGFFKLKKKIPEILSRLALPIS